MPNDISHLDPGTAEGIVEQLRYGVPPPDYVRLFTVGRESQLHELESSLSAPTGGQGNALLVKANYGAGKSHLLKIVREMALDAGYAVSLVVVNAQEGVRFNRLDTIVGSICREMEVDHSGKRGLVDFSTLSFRHRGPNWKRKYARSASEFRVVDIGTTPNT